MKDPKKGVILKLLDDIELVNRGGKMVEIVKHCAFGVPPIIIGHHLEEEEEEPPKIEVGFDLNDLLNKIPFMYPGKEPCTWRFWIDLVHSLLDPLKADGTIDEEQYLDIMQARMGGKHLKDMKRMRKEKRDRHYIEQYFLGLDKLKVKKANNSRTSRTIELLRDSIRTKWGIKLGYFTSSPTLGLQLILGEVTIGSPAWNSGLRANDALTVVNDWQLHLFKNGDAAASIFGAVGLQATATVVAPCDGSIYECKSVAVY